MFGFLKTLFGTQPKPNEFNPIAGYRYAATLQLRTPLRFLEKHGTTVGANDPRPNFGDNSQHGMHGIWVPTSNTFRSLGLDLDELPPFPHASDVGPIHPERYLPFLIAFRKIVESDRPRESQIAAIRKLKSKSDDFEVFYTELAGNYGEDDLAKGWFADQISKNAKIPIGMAKKFFDAGYSNAEEVLAATDDDLLAIKGIGKKALERLNR